MNRYPSHDMPKETEEILHNTPCHSELWDILSEKSEGIDRTVCKQVIYSMIFGANIVSVMLEHGLEIADVVNIRMAFDGYIVTKKREQR